jgi:glycosyltransferase involved in cell wall biosynthesis
MELSVIMPMYNPERIIFNLKEAIKSLEKVSKDFELIVVNDGSTNDCFEKAKEYQDNRILVTGYKKNVGKGNAISYGFKFAKGDYIAFVDSGADLNPEQLANFMKLMKQKNADVVIGSKRHSNSKVHYPLIRRIMSRMYQTVNHILFNLNVKDTQVGIKLFKRKVLERIIPIILVKKFAFDLEILVLSNKYHFKIIEAPVKMNYRFKSTINTKSVFWMLWDTAAIFYRLKILRYYDKN